MAALSRQEALELVRREQQSGRVAGGESLLRELIARQPDDAEAHFELARVLAAQRRADEAVAAMARAAALRPDLPDLQLQLSAAFMQVGRLDEAIAAVRRAVSLRPGDARGWNNLAGLLKETGELDEAVSCYRQAIEREPRSEYVSNLIFTLQFHPMATPQELWAELMRWNDRFARPLYPNDAVYCNDRNPNRRIRVGYVSADLGAHPVGFFMLPPLAHHDRTRVEVYCYSGLARPHAQTEKLRAHADHWREIAGVPDERVAQMVRDDRIDILVDLSLHTSENRLLVFARKPAPVQATYLAYCGTSGLETMDYRLTDPHLDPPQASGEFYSERSIHLPQTYWCYAAPENSPEVGPLPAERKAYLTFGCLNNYSKLSRPALEIWAQVMRKIPTSRLILHAREGSHRQRVREQLAAFGVSPQRLAFVGYLPQAQYLASYHDIDVALDPFPYGGGTTTCDALWMGVPVLTIAGSTALSRGGVSILTNVGLPELIVEMPAELIPIARGLSTDLPRLSGLRASLRGRMRGSPLMDGSRFANAMENAFRTMWENWCRR